MALASRMIRCLAVGLLATLVLASPAMALDRAALNRSLALDYAAPRYRALAEATSALRDATIEYCARPDREDLPALRSAYDSAMDAWMAAQPLRLGPITLQQRL